MRKTKFIVHVSIELEDSMIEEALRYTVDKENKIYEIGESENLRKDSYPMLSAILARLAEYCAIQSEE